MIKLIVVLLTPLACTRTPVWQDLYAHQNLVNKSCVAEWDLKNTLLLEQYRRA
jgi:hypothetical protein